MVLCCTQSGQMVESHRVVDAHCANESICVCVCDIVELRSVQLVDKMFPLNWSNLNDKGKLYGSAN